MTDKPVYADAGDPGLRFILSSSNHDAGPQDAQVSGQKNHKNSPAERETDGGLARYKADGHFGTIVGRGGAGKSILALQIVTALLDRAGVSELPHAAFYFTLEASPEELQRQVLQFKWAERYRSTPKAEPERVSGDDRYLNGLYLLSIPSPVESLNSLNLQIRQTIARQLSRIESLVAIVIDPMGAISAGEDLRVDLSQLKELSETHRTFVFLLTEKHAFADHRSIEHYSQSIIHLEHDPDEQPHRRLYIQKARGQGFRSGYHHFELQDLDGVRVYPSIGAQSAYAHDRLAEQQRRERRTQLVPFFPDEKDAPFIDNEAGIEAGSAVFLMGPPGTLKEDVAGQFAIAAGKDGATIFISFKTDIQSIERKLMDVTQLTGPKPIPFDSRNPIQGELEPAIYFFDARSPLLTPEEILFTVRNAITDPWGRRPPGPDQPTFRRAVIWGLRRLYDFPNFREGRAVQFLEALVTLLKSAEITSLLVDWPDRQKESTVPIVDLCQYIFLTRVCYTQVEKEALKDGVKAQSEGLKVLWEGARQVALLRAQRTRRGLHHDQGAILKQFSNSSVKRLPGLIKFRVEALERDSEETFENLWRNYAHEWEQDTSLLS